MFSSRLHAYVGPLTRVPRSVIPNSKIKNICLVNEPSRAASMSTNNVYS